MASTSSSALSAFLAGIDAAYRARGQDGGQRLASAIQLDAAAHNALQASLAQSNSGDWGRLVTASAKIQPSDPMHPFLVSLLEYTSQCASTSELVAAYRETRQRLATSTAQIIDAFWKWVDVYARASNVFQSQQETVFFGATLRYVGTTLVDLAVAADTLAHDSSFPRVTEAVSRVSRTTGIAAIDRSTAPGELTKRRDVLWLANLSFRCYFKLNNIRLCATVLGSVDNALTLNHRFATPQQKEQYSDSVSELGLASYSRADRVAYRYYLGRLRLSQHRIRAAYTELRWAFDNCTNAQMHNKTLILVHLLVVAIILGIYPRRALLEATGLAGPFATLVEKLKCGDGHGVYMELETWRSWHRRHGHYLLLREKLEISAWRNLLRRSFLVARLANGLALPTNASAQAGGATGPPVKTPPPTLKLANFVILARLAWRDADLSLDDVECVTASLIDQGYVKAYAMHSSGNIVFRRSPDFGFEKMSSVY